LRARIYTRIYKSVVDPIPAPFSLYICTSVPPRCSRPRGGIEGDRRSIRNIERGEASSSRHTREDVAALSCQAAQPLAFRAEHQRPRAREIRAIDRDLAIAIETNAAHAEFTKFLERPRQVPDKCDRDDLETTGGRLGERARERRAVPPGHDEPT